MSERTLSKEYSSTPGIVAAEVFLDNPENRNTLLRGYAFRAATNLVNYMATDEDRAGGGAFVEAQEFGKDTLGLLFDPDLPTLAIDVSSALSGHELIAFAAQQRRQQNLPSCNVVLFSSGTDCGRIVATDRGAHLELTHGVILDDQGRAHYGELPLPVAADVVESTSCKLAVQCEAQGVRLVSPATMIQRYGSKEEDGRVLERAGIGAPRRFLVDELQEGGAYVVKPSAHYGGHGVRIFEAGEPVDALTEYYDFLNQHGYQPLIEERIKSYPLHVKVGGEPRQRVDWNARVIIANGQYVDSYIRAHKWGACVNRSAGAVAITMDELGEYTGPETAAYLATELVSAGLKLAQQIPEGIVGADLTVGEDGKVYGYELNVGIVGGLQTVATLYDEEKRKLYGPNKMIERLLEKLPPRIELTPLHPFMERLISVAMGYSLRSPQKKILSKEKLQRGAAQIEGGLMDLGATHFITDLSLEELRMLDPSHHELGIWLAHSFHRKLSGTPEEQKQQVQALNEQVMALGPLELWNCFGEMLKRQDDPRQLLSYLEKMRQFLPHDNLWAALEIPLWAQFYAPDKTRDAFHKVLEVGVEISDAQLTCTELSARNALDRCGLTYDEKNEPTEYMKEIYAEYFEKTASSALDRVEHTLSMAKDETTERALALVGFEIAIAERDFERVAQFIPVDEEGVAIAERMLAKLTPILKDEGQHEFLKSINRLLEVWHMVSAVNPVQ